MMRAESVVHELDSAPRLDPQVRVSTFLAMKMSTEVRPRNAYTSRARVLQIIIGFIFGCIGVSKILGGHDSKFVIGPATCYAIAAFELLLSGALLKGIAPRAPAWVDPCGC
jgi:hypothetical protein